MADDAAAVEAAAAEETRVDVATVLTAQLQHTLMLIKFILGLFSRAPQGVALLFVGPLGHQLALYLLNAVAYAFLAIPGRPGGDLTGQPGMEGGGEGGGAGDANAPGYNLDDNQFVNAPAN